MQLRLDGTANTSRGILLRNTGTAEGQIQTDGNLHFIQEDAGKYMRFSTANTERMRIDSSGNLLLNTLNSPTTTKAIISSDYSATGTTNTGLTITGRQSGNWWNNGIHALGASGLVFSTGTTGTNGADATNERMRIDSSGATLVNTTAKTNSGTRLGVWADSGSVSIETRCKANVSYFPLANYSAAGSYIGGVNATTTATSLATSSDERLKENIADANDTGSKIDAIQVRQFDWKADGSHQDYGMIAQELREVIPHAVHESPDEEKMLAVDYAGLVPMLIKEIQSLRNRVATLEE